MKKLKFLTRLIIGFSIIILFSSIIGTISLIEHKNIGRNTESIYKHPLAVSNVVRDINFHIYSIHNLTKDITRSNQGNQISNIIILINQIDRQVHSAFQLIQDHFLSDKEIVNEVYQLYMDWEKTRKKMFRLIEDNKTEQAVIIALELEAYQINLLFDKTKFLSNFAQNKADQFYQATLNSEKTSRRNLIISTSILLLLSVIIAFYLSKSISSPIRNFIAEINTIFTDQILQTVSHKSEQEILGLTSNRLQTAYQKLNNFNNELDHKIEQRTAELKEAKEKAEESEKLKSAFLSNMSHEIRTPLNSILGFSEFLKNNNLSSEKKDLYVNLIETSGQRLLTIISDIVDISKIESGQFSLNYEACDLNQLIDSLHHQFTLFAAPKGIQLITNKALDNHTCFISTDHTRLSQVISNLLENAIKFTDNGSVELTYQIQKGKILFFVKDTGIGIAEEYHNFIFERFRQSDTQSPNLPTGTGLGLSIARGIIGLMGGEIWVESKPNKGACFYFKLPYLPTTAFKSEVEEDANDLLLKMGNKTILVVEDEPTNYIYLKDLLTLYNYKVLHAKNGKDAVDMIAQNPDIDLVLMDIRMPIMNGIQATHEIRKTNKTIPVIAQTSYAMSEDKRRALEAGCNDYLAKPINSKIFTRIIHRHLVN